MEQHQHNQSLQDQAYNALRSKIIYAELKPGTRLSAIGLEKETGIGRTPIRESFVRLREQELVETRPKSGTSRFLPSPSRSTIAKRVAFSIWTTCSMRRVLRLPAVTCCGIG